MHQGKREWSESVHTDANEGTAGRTGIALGKARGKGPAPATGLQQGKRYIYVVWSDCKNNQKLPAFTIVFLNRFSGITRKPPRSGK